MKLAELAWGGFMWKQLNPPSSKYHRAYNNLASDSSFLVRLHQEPRPEDFSSLREFLVNFGLYFAPSDLGQRYQQVWPDLLPHVQGFVGETLQHCDLSNIRLKDAIAEVFRCLQSGEVWGGDTAASKIIHFLNPDLFVMWDGPIQSHYQAYGADGYIEFLRKMQDQARTLALEYSDWSQADSLDVFLSKQIGYRTRRTLAKFLDDYNWVTITRECEPRLPEWLRNLYA